MKQPCFEKKLRPDVCEITGRVKMTWISTKQGLCCIEMIHTAMQQINGNNTIFSRKCTWHADVLSHPPSTHFPVMHAAAEYRCHHHGHHRADDEQDNQCGDGGNGPLNHQHHHRPERNLDISNHYFTFIISHAGSFSVSSADRRLPG